MWRKHVKPVADAEEKLFMELQRRGLTDCMMTQYPFRFDPEEDGVAGTVIDFYWGYIYQLAVFLDGEPHLKSYQQNKDDLVTKALRKRYIHVLRFRYKSPITKRRLREIADAIEESLRILGYKPRKL